MGDRMTAFRFVLLALNTSGLAFMLYVIADHPREWQIAGSFAAGLLLNILFLWTTRATKSEVPSRAVRMLRLWLDAKEADLKRRAGA